MTNSKDREVQLRYNSSYMFLCNNRCLQHPWWWSVNQNKESVVKPSKWSYRDAFFNPPFFDHFKNHWTCQKSCFLIRRGLKKPFFLSNLPPGGLVLPNESQLSNLQNGHTEMLFFNPPFFDHLKTTGHVRNHVFSSEEG